MMMHIVNMLVYTASLTLWPTAHYRNMCWHLFFSLSYSQLWMKCSSLCLCANFNSTFLLIPIYAVHIEFCTCIWALSILLLLLTAKVIDQAYPLKLIVQSVRLRSNVWHHKVNVAICLNKQKFPFFPGEYFHAF